MARIEPIHIIGGGMAGSEAAWQAARMGVPVVLHEMRPKVGTAAHKTDGLAELVCSNSFRSDDDEQNAVGLLHWEMRAAGGLIISTADRHAVPAAARSPSTASRSRPRSPPASPPTRSSPSTAPRSPACRPTTGRASSSPPAR
jgi:methylenetetrahydrofolate--tRNA-(uracil-5-)-methyltransferase